MKKIFARIFSFTRIYARIKEILEVKRTEKENIPSIKMAMFTGSIKRVK
jgi:hypothetical protein